MTSQLDLLKIGSTQGGMSTLRSLQFRYAPRTRYQPYARLLDDPTGDGNYVRRGFPRAWWSFAFLTPTEMAVFQNLLGDDETVAVYINTLKDDETYSDFSALMRIAEKTWASNWRWEEVVIEFTRLQEV